MGCARRKGCNSCESAKAQAAPQPRHNTVGAAAAEVRRETWDADELAPRWAQAEAALHAKDRSMAALLTRRRKGTAADARVQQRAVPTLRFLNARWWRPTRVRASRTSSTRRRRCSACSCTSRRW
tara:strand:- start:1481 stop:1855 length:375 start_codon:yes stop_codon:yes gene_type:complete